MLEAVKVGGVCEKDCEAHEGPGSHWVAGPGQGERQPAGDALYPSPIWNTSNKPRTA